jgi:hypothetical protein
VTLGDLGQGQIAVVTESTRCSGTMQALHLDAGTRVKVAWQHQETATFVDVLDGKYKGQLMPCPSTSPAAIEMSPPRAADYPPPERDVRGAIKDADLDPLRRPAQEVETGPRTRQARMTDEPLPDRAQGTPGAEEARTSAPLDAERRDAGRARTPAEPAARAGDDGLSPQARRSRARKPRK